VTGRDRGLGTPVVHRCETVAATGREVVHVVLPPRRPCGTPLSDLRNAGNDVLAFGVLPEEIPDCSDSDAHPRCEHLLIRK
jgi:hypothetical protein